MKEGTERWAIWSVKKEKGARKFIYRYAKKSASWFRNVKPTRNLSTIWRKGLLLKVLTLEKNWIPAGVYPDGDRCRNDTSLLKPLVYGQTLNQALRIWCLYFLHEALPNIPPFILKQTEKAEACSFRPQYPIPQDNRDESRSLGILHLLVAQSSLRSDDEKDLSSFLRLTENLF